MKRFGVAIFGLALMMSTLVVSALFVQGLYQQYWALPHLAAELGSHYRMPLSSFEIATRIVACVVLCLLLYIAVRLVGFAIRGIYLWKPN
jgi:hypothetical protein